MSENTRKTYHPKHDQANTIEPSTPPQQMGYPLRSFLQIMFRLLKINLLPIRLEIKPYPPRAESMHLLQFLIGDIIHVNHHNRISKFPVLSSLVQFLKAL
ncbi:hypothetical protein DPV78_008598 [Talaromyces pinophilus]|nr:hypothetical protein DPV78_008598 [Talaromyces pinophilus]